MQHRIADIAAALRARCVGAVDLTVTAAAEPAAAGPVDLALAMDPRYGDDLAQGRARAAILWHGADWQALGLEAAIFAPRPRLAMAGLTRVFDPGPGIAPGIHPTAVIDPSAVIGPGAGDRRLTRDRREGPDRCARTDRRTGLDRRRWRCWATRRWCLPGCASARG